MLSYIVEINFKFLLNLIEKFEKVVIKIVIQFYDKEITSRRIGSLKILSISKFKINRGKTVGIRH